MPTVTTFTAVVPNTARTALFLSEARLQAIDDDVKAKYVKLVENVASLAKEILAEVTIARKARSTGRMTHAQYSARMEFLKGIAREMDAVVVTYGT